MAPLNSYAGIIAAIALLGCLCLAFTVAGLSSRAARQGRMLRQMLSGPEGADLEVMLKRVTEASDRATARGDELEEQITRLGQSMGSCVQRIGFVRFDAYPDVSGRQSFSLVMLNGRGDGTILTGLFGRSDGRCFGKSVVGGQADAPLSEEEEDALQMALTGAPLPELESAASGSRNGRVRTRGRR